MFDAVVDAVTSKGCLNQSFNSGPDTDVEIKGDGKLTKEVGLEQYAVHIAKGFNK